MPWRNKELLLHGKQVSVRTLLWQPPAATPLHMAHPWRTICPRKQSSKQVKNLDVQTHCLMHDLLAPHTMDRRQGTCSRCMKWHSASQCTLMG